ncbi:uncharacterized protein MONBRDRAFT_17162 [Monosiga brevicollis MX1]|uniref:Battenin n=1 Tax=Monosiga brevicollis TaxID=81824 RepID=A9UPW7_MONBE|nr:uncharacterized protein MONBRDRAFT_17162 [Monosiga brevicollis MX1]EDQ92491.1 predicted protein [Monosiga brevicollis MX1]|eukprot:XP_001742253.1 hypothetical protein [Monosiga brevicollis MX1]
MASLAHNLDDDVAAQERLLSVQDGEASYGPTDDEDDEAKSLPLTADDKRDMAAFWILGLCNNFGYVIMLSGANDMLSKFDPNLGTGVVLLCDIIPTLIIKPIAPLLLAPLPYSLRVNIAILFALAAFLLVAFAKSVEISLLGVICASISSGLGEVTILAFSSMFNKRVISAWSSGTGAAGAIGAASYLGLTALMSPADACLSMTFVPALMLAAYYLLLSKRPEGKQRPSMRSQLSNSDKVCPARDSGIPILQSSWRIFRQLLPRYMVPLFLVYFAEYCINQGLYEHMLFKDHHVFSKAAQYRLYQTLYQIGVFLSRSSVQFFPVKRLWIPTALQCVNFVLLAIDTELQLVPSIWIFCVWIFYEGLLGGLAYVNAFYLISKNTAPNDKEFAMGITSVADATGIALAGAVSLGLNAAFRHKTAR